MKKVVLILFASLILAGILIYVSFQLYIKISSKKGALQVTSVPESKVFLDDKYIGQTPLCKCEADEMIQDGEYTIRLSPTDKKFADFQEKITVSEGILTVVDRRFGKDSLSDGSIISLTPLKDKQKTELLVVSFPQGSTVLLDGNMIGSSPLLYADITESDHVVKVRKNGYKEKIIKIRASRGYKLTISAYLSIDPDALNDVAKQASSSASLTPSLSTTPSPTGKEQSVTGGAQVVILETPTGFLRVRQNNTLNSAEVGRVTPGESFPLLNEQSGWYQITLNDGTTGWISSQYAEKK